MKYDFKNPTRTINWENWSDYANPFLAGCEWWWQQFPTQGFFLNMYQQQKRSVDDETKMKMKGRRGRCGPFIPSRLPDHILFPSFVSFLIQQNQPFLLTWWCFIIHKNPSTLILPTNLTKLEVSSCSFYSMHGEIANLRKVLIYYYSLSVKLSY